MNLKRLIISLVLPQLAGIVSSFFTVSAIPTWYAAIQKPSFNPPNWIFGPVWLSLYFLMGISVYLIWQKLEEDKKAKTAMWLFWIHLFFNATWSIIFFGLRSPGLALINLGVIWVFIFILMIKFWQINKWSACLLVPYFIWVSFAGVLNYFIWYLN